MNKSYWIESTKNLSPKFDELNEDIETDVCIIGAGITGISTAYELALNGLSVAIVDRRKDICTHTTGNTTAKITSGHGLFYKYLINSFSEKIAKQYLYANEEAISNIKTIVTREKIDCDFEIKDNYIFTESLEEIPKIQDEAAAITSLGIDAEFVTECDLPLDILGAVKLKNQAQFHPRKYALGLCRSILKNNGQIYINTKVYDVKHEENQYTTYTETGKITSKYVVLATHYPIINAPGFYFLKMYQERSYIIGVETNSALFDGMYINSEQPTLSFRTAKYERKRAVAGWRF